MNARATWLNQEFVRDGNLGTSRGPQDPNAIVPGILELFGESAPDCQRTPAANSFFVSAHRTAAAHPGRDEVMPKPSIRTAFMLGAAGLGLLAENLRRSMA